MTITTEIIEARKKELSKDYIALEEKVNTGEKALESMKANLLVMSGALQQCSFFLNMGKKDIKDK